MKRILFFISVFALVLTACEGEQGPPGFDGLDGLNGQTIASSAFEIEIDFTAANNFEFIEAYGFEVFPSDVTLVYILWDTVNGQDVWRLLPQTVIFDNGSSLVYNFDFTQNDVSFFLEGTTNLNTLGTEWTQNQIFRVVVVPADAVGSFDTSSLMKFPNSIILQVSLENKLTLIEAIRLR